jgi:hypothetical protein
VRAAAKEGGFMGFKVVQVSAGEQAMLDQLRSALDPSCFLAEELHDPGGVV